MELGAKWQAGLRCLRQVSSTSTQSILVKGTTVTTLPFDTQNIHWNTLEGLAHVAYHICAVDEEKRIVDILFKFDANSQIGELRIYRANGELKEVRPVGSYVSTLAGGEPHREGGGDQDVIAFFSNRNVDGPIYEILDDDLNIIAVFGIPEFKALWEAQPTTTIKAAE